MEGDKKGRKHTSTRGDAGTKTIQVMECPPGEKYNRYTEAHVTVDFLVKSFRIT